MEVIIDKYGRIVIPKQIRERLALDSGSELEISIESTAEGGEVIALRPAGQEPVLRMKGRVLVHTGKSDEPLDPVEAVKRARDDRTRQLLGPARKKAS